MKKITFGRGQNWRVKDKGRTITIDVLFVWFSLVLLRVDGKYRIARVENLATALDIWQGVPV